MNRQAHHIPRAAWLALLAILAIPAAAAPGTPAPDPPVGQVVPLVACAGEPGYSFALYLPKAYTADKKWPVVFCFSPVGRGDEPVRLLADSAERYGWILAGSNDSRNGPFEAILKAQEVLWKEITSRFSVDMRRCYATGFSGGGRAAVYLALSHRESFAGVIPCGAIDPERIKMPKSGGPYYVMMVGDQDFNFYEFTRFQKSFLERGTAHWLQVFDGPHRWPPKGEMDNAAELLQVRAMTAGDLSRDEAFLAGALDRQMARARELEGRGLMLRAYDAYAQTATLFAGVPGAEAAQVRARELNADAAVVHARAQVAKFEAYHKKLIGAADGKVLLGNLRELDAMRKAGGEDAGPATTLMTMSAFQLAQLGAELLGRSQYPEAAFCFDTAAGLLPANPVVLYNAACAASRVGRPDDALEYLRRSVDAGFKDGKHMAADPDLASLRKNKDFQAIVSSLGGPPK